MFQTISRLRMRSLLAVGVFSVAALSGCSGQKQQTSAEFVQYGSMHETIGQKQHEGRVSLAAITERPHFYGVGAVEGLRGEITIEDSVAVVTGVAADGRVQAMDPGELRACMLVGESAAEWASVEMAEGVGCEAFDDAVAEAAKKMGVDCAAPFVFVIKGEFTDVRLHVIHGACPIRARMRNEPLAADERPFEFEADRVAGTLVGVYAADAVGKLTHPATRTHAHLVYADPGTGELVTGHIERVGVAAGELQASCGSPVSRR